MIVDKEIMTIKETYKLEENDELKIKWERNRNLYKWNKT